MDVMTPYVPAVELIYRSLAQPKPQEPKPASVEAPPAIELTRADVTAIIHRKRLATAEELQEIINHGKQFKLTDGERNQLCCDLTIAMSQRACQINERLEDPNSRFIDDLGYAPTPFWLATRAGIVPDRVANRNQSYRSVSKTPTAPMRMLEASS
jgi:hypothetical protein